MSFTPFFSKLFSYNDPNYLSSTVFYSKCHCKNDKNPKSPSFSVSVIVLGGKWSWGQISWDWNLPISGGQIINHDIEIHIF